MVVKKEIKEQLSCECWSQPNWTIMLWCQVKKLSHLWVTPGNPKISLYISASYT